MKLFHAKRLAKLADHLEGVPRARFNMSCWAKENGCGTVACAAGHACTIKSFNRAGLRLDRDEYGNGTPTFKGLADFQAIEEFFGINEDESWMFHPSCQFYKTDRPTPKTVAKAFRKFLKSKGFSPSGERL